MARLGHVAPACSGSATDDEMELPLLSKTAVAIGALAAEAVTALGADTVAKGFAHIRGLGYRVPSHLEREVRQLDAAAHLLRHPKAAARIVEQLKTWLAQQRQQQRAISEAESPGPSSSSSLKLSRCPSVASGPAYRAKHGNICDEMEPDRLDIWLAGNDLVPQLPAAPPFPANYAPQSKQDWSHFYDNCCDSTQLPEVPQFPDLPAVSTTDAFEDMQWFQEFDAALGPPSRATFPSAFVWYPCQLLDVDMPAATWHKKLEDAFWPPLELACPTAFKWQPWSQLTAGGEANGGKSCTATTVQSVLMAYNAKCAIVMTAGLSTGAMMAAAASWCKSLSAIAIGTTCIPSDEADIEQEVADDPIEQAVQPLASALSDDVPFDLAQWKMASLNDMLVQGKINESQYVALLKWTELS